MVPSQEIKVDEMKGDFSVNLGHQLDVQAFLSDIYLLSGKTPKASFVDNQWMITIPRCIVAKFKNLSGLVIGKRSTQAATLPEFLLDKKCPRSIIREFLGGLFGGDGCSPHLASPGKIGTPDEVKGDNNLIGLGFIQTTCGKFLPDMKIYLENICKFLESVGVSNAYVLNERQVLRWKKKALQKILKLDLNV